MYTYLKLNYQVYNSPIVDICSSTFYSIRKILPSDVIVVQEFACIDCWIYFYYFSFNIFKM